MCQNFGDCKYIHNWLKYSLEEHFWFFCNWVFSRFFVNFDNTIMLRYNITYFLQKDDIMLHFTLSGSSDITGILVCNQDFKNQNFWLLYSNTCFCLQLYDNHCFQKWIHPREENISFKLSYGNPLVPQSYARPYKCEIDSLETRIKAFSNMKYFRGNLNVSYLLLSTYFLIILC